MAEIRIRQRRPRATWPWFLVLAVPFLYLLTLGRTSEAGARVVSDSAAAASVIPRDTLPPPNPLDLLARYAAAAPDSAAATRAYAATGLDRAIAAVSLLGAAGAPTNQQALQQIQADRDRVGDTKRVSDLVASDRMHDAAVKLADILESANVGGRHHADAQVNALRIAAGNVHTTGALGAQRAEVQQLLAATASAVSAMHPVMR